VEHPKKVEGREFLFKLALELGMTVHQLENTMTHQELSEWYEYYNIEPFKADRQESQLATLSFLISTANGGKSHITDFLITHKKPKINTQESRIGFVQSFINKEA
jgi:hypothetical protein